MIHQAVAEINMDDINLSSQFIGKKVDLPIIVNAITGGTEKAAKINKILAKTAKKYNIPMAVGSQTIAIKSPELVDTFSIVRKENPDGIIIANIGASENASYAMQAIDMIAADAIQLHFNIPQELAMLEGDRNFKNLTANVSEIVLNSPVPVIAKEVGFGFSKEAVTTLYDAGIRYFDIGGKGGTNFVAIEDQRQGLLQGEFNDWGIPTAHSLAEVISLKLPIKVISSGGIRTTLDITKSLAMGADYVGMAGLFLKLVINQSEKALAKTINEMIYRLKASFLMCGAKNIAELRQKPVIILGQTKDYLEARNIDTSLWSNKNQY